MSGVGRPIDHVVIAVRDLDHASSRLEAAGFTLTPKALHGPHMGTCNRLVQFADGSFLEILTVDRPGGIQPHRRSTSTGFFSFGAYNREFLKRHEGASMLVFKTDDAVRDANMIKHAGGGDFEPFSFGRDATQPDGSILSVRFSLAFAHSPNMPDLAFFVCQNHYPENFWKPEFQRHANGASGIAQFLFKVENPRRDATFVGRLFGASVNASGLDEGQSFLVSNGPRQSLQFVEAANQQSEKSAATIRSVLIRDCSIGEISLGHTLISSEH